MFKKLLVFVAALVMGLGIFSGCGNVELQQGTYITDDKISWVTLHDDNKFEFSINILNSYCPQGTYSIKRRKLILYVSKEEQYIFNIKDGNLIFVSTSGGEWLAGRIFKLSD